MSDYAIKNFLNDIEDVAGGRGVDGVEARSGRSAMESEHLGVSLFRVAPPVARAFEAGPEGLDLLAVGNDRPDGGDGEMVEDFWQD
jgi:hypothetical protein